MYLTLITTLLGWGQRFRFWYQFLRQQIMELMFQLLADQKVLLTELKLGKLSVRQTCKNILQHHIMNIFNLGVKRY